MAQRIAKRELVKARIRTVYGSVAAFERAKGLPPQSVGDVLRGRSNQRVSKLIENEFQSTPPSSVNPDSSTGAGAHRLSEAAE